MSTKHKVIASQAYTIAEVVPEATTQDQDTTHINGHKYIDVDARGYAICDRCGLAENDVTLSALCNAAPHIQANASYRCTTTASHELFNGLPERLQVEHIDDDGELLVGLYVLKVPVAVRLQQWLFRFFS